VARYQREQQALLDAHLVQMRERGQRPFLIPTGASDAIGVWGYVSACEELSEDFRVAGIRPRHVVCATGSGGTQAGLTAGLHLQGLDCEAVGIAVCDDAAWFQAKVRADIAGWVTRYGVDLDPDRLRIHVLDQYIGPGYAQATPAVFATIARLARTEGLVLDPVYTGKAFHGLLAELSAGRLREADDIVFVHTGGVFGLFPQREELQRASHPPSA
jgi:D-cysteine desulfhydrase